MTFKAFGIFLRVTILRQSSLAARPEVADWDEGAVIWFDDFGVEEGLFVKVNSKGRIVCQKFNHLRPRMDPRLAHSEVELFDSPIWAGYNRTIWGKDYQRRKEEQQAALRNTITEPPTEMPDYREPVQAQYQVGSWREN